jgi:hypothetical protein
MEIAISYLHVYRSRPGALSETWLPRGRSVVGVYETHGKLDGRWLDVVIVERVIPANLT